MGAVYEAFDADSATLVAIKTLFDSSVEHFLAFKREFRELQGIHHPNLVALGELFEDDGRWFFSMERIEGVPLQEFVSAHEFRLRACLVQLVEGLAALHHAGKVHRDVKPSNILVESSGRVVLLDFGLIADARDPLGCLMPRAGTASYMAPEQRLGRAGPAADWYSLGVMLHEILHGHEPRESVPSTCASDLQALCSELLVPEPERRPSGPEILQRLRAAPAAQCSSRRAKPPFVGRDTELLQLTRSLERTRTTMQPVALFVRGESGVGKSTLVQRFVETQLRVAHVLAGRCNEYEYIPFKALDAPMDALARTLARLSDRERRQLLRPNFAALARIFPVFRGFCAGDERLPVDAHELRRAATLVLRELLVDLARCTPVALIIDDIQWADADSLALLEELLNGEDAPALLVVVIGRNELQLPLLPHRTELSVERLSEAEARHLAEALMRETPAQIDAARVARESGGHPLFIETLVGEAGAESTGKSLAETLFSKVAALEPAPRELVELASVAAQPLGLAVLAASAQVDAPVCASYVRRLQAARLLGTRPGGAQAAIEPYHDALRRAVAARLDPEKLRARHRAVAVSLEALEPDHADVLAFHWFAAGEPDAARKHAWRAADRALEALAFVRAASLYQWVIELSPPSDPRLCDAHRRRAEALGCAGVGADSARAFETAAKHADPAAAWDLKRRAAEQLLRSGHLDDGLALMRDLLGVIGMRLPRSRVSALGTMVAECARAAIAPTPPGDPAARTLLARRADACWTLGYALALISPVACAVFQLRHLHLARRLGDLPRIALGLSLNAPPAAASGAPATRARAMLAEAEQLLERHPDAHGLGFHALSSANVEFLCSDWPRALAQSERAINLFESSCTGVSWELSTAHRLALDALWHMGRLADLETRLTRALSDASARGDQYAIIQLESTVLSVVHLKRDEPETALRALENHISTWPHRLGPLQSWQLGQCRALVELYLGRPRRALESTRTPMNSIDRALLWRFQAVRLFSHHVRATAALAVAADREADARSRISEARAYTAKISRDSIATGSHALLSAELSYITGEHSRCADELERSYDGYKSLHMGLMAAVAEHAWGRLVGGVEGHQRCVRVEEFMRSQGIRQPRRFIDMMAPAFRAL